jgi:hypothetical protein
LKSPKYHPITRNCHQFVSELIEAICLPGFYVPATVAKKLILPGLYLDLKQTARKRPHWGKKVFVAALKNSIHLKSIKDSQDRLRSSLLEPFTEIASQATVAPLDECMTGEGFPP